MIADLKPYPAMKDSRVDWLGDVPEHWEVLPLARLLKERNEKNGPIKTTNILSLRLETGVIPYADESRGGNKAKEDLSAYMLAYPGDIVLNSMNVVVGSVGLSKYFGAVSPVYYMLRPRSSNDFVEYFNAIFHDVVFQRSLFGLGNGILYIESKATGKLNTIRLTDPYVETQTGVAPISLSHRTSRHRPLPRPRGPADSALHPRQAEADQAAGGAEAGHHPPRRHPRPRPQRPPQALRRGVARRRAGALGECRFEGVCSRSSSENWPHYRATKTISVSIECGQHRWSDPTRTTLARAAKHCLTDRQTTERYVGSVKATCCLSNVARLAGTRAVVASRELQLTIPISLSCSIRAASRSKSVARVLHSVS